MLSIVIPYYKLTFFEETLQSLVNQTCKRFKVYIFDDASPEHPTVLLKKYQGKFDFIYYRFEENLGGVSLVRQWERCIELTKEGEWIMILGDDDVLGDNVVEEFYNFLSLNLNEIDVVRFATCKIDVKSKVCSEIFFHSEFENSIDILFQNKRSSLSEYIFKLSKVSKIGFKDFPLGWFSDVLAILEFSNLYIIYTINKSIVRIRISNLSISGNQNNYKLKSKATLEFYIYLLKYKYIYFDKTQVDFLFEKFSNCFFNNKREYFFFFEISKIYLTHFLIKKYIFFLRRILTRIV